MEFHFPFVFSARYGGCISWNLPSTPIGNQVGEEIKKEIHDEKKREFSPPPCQCFFFEFSVFRNFATWQSVLELALLHGRIDGLSVQLHGAKICS